MRRCHARSTKYVTIYRTINELSKFNEILTKTLIYERHGRPNISHRRTRETDRKRAVSYKRVLFADVLAVKRRPFRVTGVIRMRTSIEDFTNSSNILNENRTRSETNVSAERVSKLSLLVT